MSSIRVRTDLALEARENMEENAEALRGVYVEEEYHEESEIRVTRVVIETKKRIKSDGEAYCNLCNTGSPGHGFAG